MRLLDFPPAPNPRKVRVFIAEKGIDLPIVPVDVAGGENRTQEFLATKNPFGGLPVLELDDGSAISESIAICRYLEALHPDPPLFGVGVKEQAIVEMWNRRIELELFRNVGDYFRNCGAFFKDKFVQSAPVGEDARRMARDGLAWLDGALADRDFIAGERFSIADISALIAIDLGSPTVFEIQPEQKNLARWYEAVSNRPSAAA